MNFDLQLVVYIIVTFALLNFLFIIFCFIWFSVARDL
jgi:hypothetical protein